MKKIIFIEELQVGNFLFQGYITCDDIGDLSYCIFVNRFEHPFIEMASKNLQITITFNQSIADFINTNKHQDKNSRKNFFKLFYDFLLTSEKKASYMVFKKKKLHYIKNSKEIIRLKQMYIEDRN